MREYLKAIGFSDLNSRKKIDELINEIKKNPSRKNWFQIDEEEAIFIYEKDFAEAAGIAVIEVMDRDGYRVTDHFYPYVRGANYLYHEDLESGIVCGIFLFLANCFQQTGIQYTTVGKAGFITTFYIIIVPVVGLFFKKYCGILTWIGVVIALAGLYFLCITEKMTIQRGDALILCCSFLYTGQILAIDHYNPFVDGVKMSCIQFLTGGMLGAICMFLFESPNMAMILNAAGPILYTGIMSTGVGYTLQILGQKGLNPTVAALIMSLESVFSALSGYLFLHQFLTTRELIGCVLMFIAIVLAQLPDIRRKV